MGITLFISEKPSLGRTVAKALGIVKDQKTHVVCERDCVVAFAQGHLYDYMMPDEYDPRYKQWRREDLPLDIPKLRLKAQESTKYRLEVIEKFLKQADRVIHVGDPDREGQRIVDDILEQAGWKGPVERLWNTDQSERGMKRTLEEFEKGFPDNNLPIYRNMLAASRARAEIDWRLGMNFSRAIGCRLNAAGIRKTVSYGRFQSAVLAMIVHREIERENFRPKKFYTPKAVIDGVECEFIHDPEAFPDGYDPEGYLTDRAVAEGICDLVRGKEGEVAEYERKKGTKSPPLPYDLSRLIQDANRLYKISAKETNDIAQKLYDAGITTYPRVDCRYLPDGHHQDAQRILGALSGLAGADTADAKIKGKCFNSKKTDEAAHHAIVPTGDPWQKLSGKDRQVFELVARNYILQFHPDEEFETQKLVVRFDGPPKTLFKANGRKVIAPGWTAVMKDEDDDGAGELPAFRKGQGVVCDSAKLAEGETKKPPAFTEATIVNAMENIDKFEPNPEYKKLLKNAKGIGTGATRGGILEVLKDRNYITISKGTITPTQFGRDIISYIPEPLHSPALTAIMEGRLEDIAQGRSTTEEVLAEINGTVPGYLEDIDGVEIKGAEQTSQPCPICGTGTAIRLHSAKTGRDFWKCQNEGCGEFFEDSKGRLVVPEKCPACGAIACKRWESKNRKGAFYWRCGKCGEFFDDSRGRLSLPEKCPECGEAACKRWESKSKKGAFYWRCGKCGKSFADEGGKMGEAFAPKLTCECPECGGSATRYKLKSGEGFFWKCEKCGFFEDDDGKIGRKRTPGLAQEKCPECGGTATRYKSRKDGGFFWKCEKCGFFDDDDGRIGRNRSNGLAQDKCPECGGLCIKLKSQKGTLFWKCKKCDHAFADEDGKPGRMFGQAGGGGQSATCPHCKKEKAWRNQSKTGNWYWRCAKCGNMKDNDGKPGDLFDKKPAGKKG